MISSLALVVVVVIDQFRTDEYFRAKASLSKAGLARVLDQGIFYDDAHHSQFFNVTCPGHVAISTGADPGLHGIIENFEWDKKLKKTVYCMADPDHKWLEAASDASEGSLSLGTSAKRILTTTLGDEMKLLWKDESKIVSVGLKDRSAIALAGHDADGVYWFAPKTKVWTTSTAYTTSKELPPWLKAFNKKINGRPNPPGDKYFFSADGVSDMTDLALAAVDAHKLGQHKKIDALWLAYSTHDYVGHQFGDDSKELHGILQTEDRNIAKLMAALQKKLGNKKFIIVVTADHGAGIDALAAAPRGIPGGKTTGEKTKAALNKCLGQSGQGSVAFLASGALHLSEDTPEARIKAKQCLAGEQAFWSAFTKEEVLGGHYPSVPWLKGLGKSYHPQRGPDVVGVLNPYWNSETHSLITHETPYDYDSWVPLAIWWPGVKPQKIHRRVEVTSLAPTLARILETRRPSGAMSELLQEVLTATH